MNGLTLGNRYSIIEKIGEGGMAVVYKALDLKLERAVAVKVLKAEFSSDKDFVKKFKAEAMAAASINDGNIVSIYDVGTYDDLNYIVMELVEGQPLNEIIKNNGVLTSSESIAITLQVANALKSAHKNNIVHRDIKPHNIIVTDNGVAKVTDFGIAKTITSETISNDNRVLGSVYYISPEQAKGEFVDNRSDIYSLGAVLYEMVTGRVPFEAETPVSVALKHIQEKLVPPNQLNKEIPDSINSIIVKTLEKNPLIRYQSAEELCVDLSSIKNGYTINTKPRENEYTIVMKPIDVKEGTKPSIDEFLNDKKLAKSKKRKIILSIFIALGILLSGVLAFVLGSLLPNGSSSSEVKVPVLVNLTKADAEKSLDDMGLKYKVDDTGKSGLEAGLVYASDPETDTNVKKGTVVTLFVSSGVSLKVVPNLVGNTLDMAKNAIKNSDFKLGTVEEQFSDIDAGIVISQNPTENDKLDKGGLINLVVSKGLDGKDFDLKGKTLEEARSAVGADIKIVPYYLDSVKISDKVNDGKIQIQDKTRAKKGDTIKVTIINYLIKLDESKINGSDVSLEEAEIYLDSIGINYKISNSTKDMIKNPSKYVVNSYTPSNVKSGGTVNLDVKASVSNKKANKTPEETAESVPVDQTQPVDLISPDKTLNQ